MRTVRAGAWACCVTAAAIVGATAGAGEPLAEDALRRAAWRRDLPAVLAGPYELSQLPEVARLLCGFRDADATALLEVLARSDEPGLRRAAAFALGCTPGAADVVRARLDVEGEAAVRGALGVALGRVGGAEDLPRLMAGLAGAPDEAVGAAQGIGRLARRGVDASEAVPTLVRVASAPRPRVAEAAAFALGRIRPAALAEADVRALARAWRRALSGEARAWLVPSLVAHLPESEARALALDVLDGPWREAKVALLGALRPGLLSEGTLEALAASDDPWIARSARDALPAAAPDPACAVAGGAACPLTSLADEALLARALEAEVAADRTAAARVLLERGPPADRVEALGAGDDPYVRELVALHGGERLDGAALVAALRPWLDPAGGPSLVRTVLDVLAQADPPLTADDLGEDGLADLRRLAAEGPFGVAREAEALLAASGAPGPIAASRPDPALPAVVTAASEGPAPRTATIHTDRGDFRIAFEPGRAPLAVAAFAHLAQADAFDGRLVHRVVPGFVVQTGDPRDDSLGGPGWFLPDELSPAPFDRGAVGMARSGPDTGGSQWFVTLADQPHLVGDYTRFGRVVEGMQVVDRLDVGARIEDVTLTWGDRP